MELGGVSTAAFGAFLLPPDLLARYVSAVNHPGTCRLGDVARVGIGYVTGANDFFHLKPSAATELGISQQFLHTAVRNGRALTGSAVTTRTVEEWLGRDEPVLLLRIAMGMAIPASVRRYLDSDAGHEARRTYKCVNRHPWYVVPDVHVPDAFLSYMSGQSPSLVANQAGCVATNSVHTVRLKRRASLASLVRSWRSPLRELSCEIEGHPLGGGMLKIEPREASRIVIGSPPDWTVADDKAARVGVSTLRNWRHCAA